ncbi:class I lanthipeptide [Chryseobacterium sp. M5A1_1a]
MSNKHVKLEKKVSLNKDTITRLQETELNKLKGGIGFKEQQDATLSCLMHSCNSLQCDAL